MCLCFFFQTCWERTESNIEKQLWYKLHLQILPLTVFRFYVASREPLGKDINVWKSGTIEKLQGIEGRSAENDFYSYTSIMRRCKVGTERAINQ